MRAGWTRDHEYTKGLEEKLAGLEEKLASYAECCKTEKSIETFVGKFNCDCT